MRGLNKIHFVHATKIAIKNLAIDLCFRGRCSISIAQYLIFFLFKFVNFFMYKF